MDRRGFLAGLCAIGASALAIGCGGGAPGNIPEERVITKEESEDMMKKLEEGRKGMNKAPGRK